MDALLFLVTGLYYLVLLIVLLLILIYIYFHYAFQYWKRRNVEYLKPNFPYGNVNNFFQNIHLTDRLEELYNTIKGPYAGVYFFNNPVLFVKDPELLKHVLVKDANNFLDRGVHVDVKKDPISGHLFRLGGKKWRILRNKLSPLFTSAKLKMMFPLVKKCGEQLQEQYQNLNRSGQIVDMWYMSSSYTSDVISSTMFGMETNSFQDTSEIVTFIKGFLDTTESKKMSIMTFFSICVPRAMKLFKLQIINKKIADFLYGIVRKIIKDRETNKVVRKDFMQLMIQLKNTGKVTDDDVIKDASIYDQNIAVRALTLDEIVAQAFVYIMAGYETSAATISFCLYELAMHSEIQKRVQKDIDEVLQRYGGKISYESVKEMEYLSMVMSETLRKYPPLGFLNRIATEDYQIPNSNVVIEKGTQLIISVQGLHHDSNIYSEPMRFHPERFNLENKDLINPFTYLPFGEGPRHCIGIRLAKMQTSVGLAMLLCKYTVTTCPKTPKHIPYVSGKIITSPFGEVNLLLTKRI